MLEILVPILLWLSGVHSDMQMDHGLMADNMDSLQKSKRDSVPHEPPCPQHYPSAGPWAQQQVYVKSYSQPMYSHVQYAQHAPSYVPMVEKYPVGHIKPESINYKPVYNIQSAAKPIYIAPFQPKVDYQKPMLSYAPIYQKPMYEMPKAYIKKYEAPITQVVYQKPMVAYKQPVVPISYVQPEYHPKIVQVQQPMTYVKIAHPPPMVHPSVYYSPVGHIPSKYPCD